MRKKVIHILIGGPVKNSMAREQPVGLPTLLDSDAARPQSPYQSTARPEDPKWLLERPIPDDFHGAPDLRRCHPHPSSRETLLRPGTAYRRGKPVPVGRSRICQGLRIHFLRQPGEVRCIRPQRPQGRQSGRVRRQRALHGLSRFSGLDGVDRDPATGGQPALVSLRGHGRGISLAAPVLYSTHLRGRRDGS